MLSAKTMTVNINVSLSLPVRPDIAVQELEKLIDESFRAYVKDHQVVVSSIVRNRQDEITDASFVMSRPDATKRDASV